MALHILPRQRLRAGVGYRPDCRKTLPRLDCYHSALCSSPIYVGRRVCWCYTHSRNAQLDALCNDYLLRGILCATTRFEQRCIVAGIPAIYHIPSCFAVFYGRQTERYLSTNREIKKCRGHPLHFSIITSCNYLTTLIVQPCFAVLSNVRI